MANKNRCWCRWFRLCFLFDPFVVLFPLWLVLLFLFLISQTVATFRKGVRAVQMVGRASTYQTIFDHLLFFHSFVIVFFLVLVSFSVVFGFSQRKKKLIILSFEIEFKQCTYDSIFLNIYIPKIQITTISRSVTLLKIWLGQIPSKSVYISIYYNQRAQSVFLPVIEKEKQIRLCVARLVVFISLFSWFIVVMCQMCIVFICVYTVYCTVDFNWKQCQNCIYILCVV